MASTTERPTQPVTPADWRRTPHTAIAMDDRPDWCARCNRALIHPIHIGPKPEPPVSGDRVTELEARIARLEAAVFPTE